MKWNQNKSVKLTQTCIYLFMGLFAIICVCAPSFFRWLFELQGVPGEKLPVMLLTIYAGAVPAAGALWDLNRLLHQIRAGQVFIKSNVTILRRLSWECMAGALACIFGGLVYPAFFLIGGIAAFIGLILRVVKNVFAQAVELQDENDFTI